MILVPKGDLPRLTHYTLLKDEQAWADHVVDVLFIYHCIIALQRDFDDEESFRKTL